MECKGSQKEKERLSREYKRQKADAEFARFKDMFGELAPDVKFVDVTPNSTNNTVAQSEDKE